MRKHCQGQQGRCPQCAGNIQCCVPFLTSLAVCSGYSSRQNKARTQAESWATLIPTSLLLACSLAQLWLPRRLALPARLGFAQGKAHAQAQHPAHSHLVWGAWAVPLRSALSPDLSRAGHLVREYLHRYSQH